MHNGAETRRQGQRGLVVLACALVWLCSPLATCAAPSVVAPGTPATPELIQASQVETGRRLYESGVLGSGQMLTAIRLTTSPSTGAKAACIGCHRASGMGSTEGNLRIAPINGKYLFAEPGDFVMATMDGQRGKSLNQAHPPYSAVLFDRALRHGVNANGQTMADTMPHFALENSDRQALLAYLAQLGPADSPGVTKTTIRFATVITPDVSPERRAIVLSMIKNITAAKNGSTAPRKRYMTSAASFVSQSERRWDIDVWQLSGTPDTWDAQLASFYARVPVFALVSGISDSTWDPVAAFCNVRHLPCWFPSGTAPTPTPTPYALYFSRGTVLEAEVLAKHIGASGDVPGKIIQVIDDHPAARAAAAALAERLQRHNTSVTTWNLPRGAGALSAARIAAVAAGDIVVAWLDQPHADAIGRQLASDQRQFYVSGTLYRAPLATAGTPHLLVVYPFELPSRRKPNLAYLHTWLQLRGLPLVDEELQSEVFFSFNLLTDMLQDMLGNLYRDYLIERTEDMLGKRERMKAEQESRDRQTLGRPAKASVIAEALEGSAINEAGSALSAQRRAFGLGPSEGTTVYPHLSLGPGQRFASKGAYIATIPDNPGATLSAVSDWIVP